MARNVSCDTRPFRQKITKHRTFDKSDKLKIQRIGHSAFIGKRISLLISKNSYMRVFFSS